MVFKVVMPSFVSLFEKIILTVFMMSKQVL